MNEKLSHIKSHSVHQGINPPQKTPPSLFLAKPLLKSANCPSPPFQVIPSILISLVLVCFFFVKLQPPLKKVTPSFPATPLSKLRSCQAPLFENLVVGSTLPPSLQQKGGGGVHTMKAARLVYITMIIPLLTSSCTLKSPYNNTQKLKYNSLDRRARKIIKLNVPSIENLANRERVLLVKSCLCKESNEKFNNYFKLIEHKYETRNNSKSIKLPHVKLELAKQGFYFSGGVLYNSLPIEIRDTDGYGKFKELVKAHFSQSSLQFHVFLKCCHDLFFSFFFSV